MNLSFGIGDRIYQTTLAFEDRMALQSFPLKIPDFEKDMVLSAMIFVLEITQVYPGSEWQDTCVAEIELRDRNGRKIPVLP